MQKFPGILMAAALCRMAEGMRGWQLQLKRWAEPMSTGTSAQQAELPALTQALELGQGQKVSVYNDSRYSCAKALVHGSMYKERGLLTIKEKKNIKTSKLKNKFWPSSKPYGYPRNWPPSIAQATREVMDALPRETSWQTNHPTDGTSD